MISAIVKKLTGLKKTKKMTAQRHTKTFYTMVSPEAQELLLQAKASLNETFRLLEEAMGQLTVDLAGNDPDNVEAIDASFSHPVMDATAFMLYSLDSVKFSQFNQVVDKLAKASEQE